MSIPRQNHFKGGEFSNLNTLVLTGLIIVPLFACMRLACDFKPLFVFSYLACISIATWLSYWEDKKSAQTGRWRTSEATLHSLELLGGWPAAYIAQRTLRHKTSKPSYQIKFRIIVLFHQFVAFDFLAGWRITRTAYHLFQHLVRTLVH